MFAAMEDHESLFDGTSDAAAPEAAVGGRGSLEARDPGLDDVVAWFRGQKDLEARFGSAFRQSFDEVLDGQRTGRFDINAENVTKTEKTYLGTKVEIVVRSTFELPKGERMDYKVAGHDIDAKFSISGVWAIPAEAMGHLCLVMSADDHKWVFSVGIVRIRPEILNKGKNRDQKGTISKEGRGAITWLAREASLPKNLLLGLPQETINRIFDAGSGQSRINELLRSFQGKLIDRNTAITVAQQLDGPKRCRDARVDLRPEGIAVLGHQNDSPRIAKALGLPVPPKGMYLSVRLVSAPSNVTDRPTVNIGGLSYAVARPDDPVEPTPLMRC